MLDPQRISAVRRASLLTTMAIMKANYDVNRDLLANFEPFALDCVKHWAVGESVKPERLREYLCRRFALPEIPINTAQDLRDRLCRDGYLVVREERGGRRTYEPHAERLREVSGLEASREAALERMLALQKALTAYANRHGSSWSDERSEQALEAYVQEFSVELALSRRSRSLAIDGRSLRADVAVVHAFVRTLVRRGGRLLDFLEDMVKGSMLVNVLYFQALGDWKTRLPTLEVYIDTSVLLRALGLAPSEQATAAKELVALARSFEISMRVFRHTVEEMEGILDRVAETISSADGQLRPTELIHLNGEVRDHLIAEGWTAAEVQELAAELPAKLRDLGVQIVETPARPARPDIDEVALERMLEQVVSGQTPSARAKDVASLVGVHTLRRGRRCRTLEATPAIFVTANAAVVRASAAYFERHRVEGKVRHCVSDVSLTTQLWVRKPERSPEIARKLLIAESCAALALGPPGLYERYLTAIERQADAGALSAEQVTLLVGRMETREPLLDVTGGDVDAVSGETPVEVLERFEEELLRPANRQVEATLQSLHAIERQTRELGRHLHRHEEAARRTAERERELRQLLRTVVPGVLLNATAIAVVVGVVVLAMLGRLRGTVPLGTLGSTDLVVGYCGVVLCLGHRPRRHSRRWHFALLLALPAACGALAWATRHGAGWWVAAIGFACGAFGAAYAIYAFRAPAR